ncbi:MAG: glutathione S-transferase, partial [Candidatus Puniceispirillaceae bacterium]
EILLRDKPDAFLAVSKTATVPVLEHNDGQVIEESRDIMFWALQQSGDPEQWLTRWKQDQAGLQAFLDQLDGPFKTHLDRYKYSARFAEDKADAAEMASYHRAEGAAFLKQIDTLLNKNPFLNGSEAGLADYAALPFVRQFRIADITWFDDQDWPAVHLWLQAFLASQRFAAIMHKYTPWKPGDAPVVF